MTAAIAMAGAASASTITSQAAVRAYIIGGNGQQCETSWNNNWTGNWNNSNLPNFNQPAVPDYNGSGLPNMSVPSLPDMNQPAVPGDGSGLPDMSVPSLPDMNQPAVPGDGSGLPDMSVPSLPDTNRPAVPGEGGNGLPDMSVPGQPSEDGSNDSFTAQVAELVNQERAKAGLAPLQVDSRAEEAASVRAQEIERSFSHTRPDGSSFSSALSQSGVSFTGAGENIAYGQRTPEEVMKTWMNSQGHRANILNKDYTSIGVGYHQSSNGTGYWTQLFTR